MDSLAKDREAMMEEYFQVKAELERVAQENHKLKTENDKLSDELAERSTAVQNLMSFIHSGGV
jgi:regulator of replication initiation timing